MSGPDKRGTEQVDGDRAFSGGFSRGFESDIGGYHKSHHIRADVVGGFAIDESWYRTYHILAEVDEGFKPQSGAIS